MKQPPQVAEVVVRFQRNRNVYTRPDYKEAHVRADSGPDHPRWVATLCPNCHHRAHYGEDKAQFNQKLTANVQSIEGRLRH